LANTDIASNLDAAILSFLFSMEILYPCFFVLLGILLCTGVSFLLEALRQPQRRPLLLFAVMCALGVVSVSFHLTALHADSVNRFVFATKGALGFSGLFFVCMVWFVAIYTQFFPRWFLALFSMGCLVYLVIDVFAPFGLPFESVIGIRQQVLPWGEVFSMPIAQPSIAAHLLGVLVFNMFAYAFYAFVRLYRKTGSRECLYMMAALSVFCAFSLEGTLVRLNVIHFVPLGPFGFIGMMIVMSYALSLERNKRLRLADKVFETTREAILVTNERQQIVVVNATFCRVFGYSAEEVLDRKPQLFCSEVHDQAFYRNVQLALENTGQWQGEIWNRRKSGDLVPGWLTINTIYNHDGSIDGWVGHFVDLTAQKQSEELIWKQANFDALTGLLNRYSLHDRLEQEIRYAQCSGLALALLVIDLDRFKDVVETLGHRLGDELLKQAAQRLRNCVAMPYALGRPGGDEFALLLTLLEDVGGTGDIAARILEQLAQPFAVQNETVFLTASIGIAVYPGDAEDAVSLSKFSDQALYAAKREGRNCFNYYTPQLQRAALTRAQIGKDLHSAVREQQFCLMFQPIIDLANGEIHKAEALIRWQHPQRGLVSPADFIPIAEETGLIVPMGDWVFKEATRMAKAWRSIVADFQISINKSPLQFRDDTTHFEWAQHLNALGLPGEALVVEITEGLLADQDINSKLLQFRDAGIQVALDDFGTGYSSLAYLRRFDIDYLKIDQTFIRNLLPGSQDEALCEAIVVMAHKLGLKVIAEGVETQQQLDLLKRMGCDYGQGYLFSKPIPANEFESLIEVGRLQSKMDSNR
jgi:diguanylate cyclase (GGDEF)-like protein/PAS domain S-box-containing protein